MRFTHKWIRSVPVNLSFVLIAAVSSMTATVHAATIGKQLPGSPAASWQAVQDEAVSPATEREIVVNKLQRYGFSEKEARLLLPTMSSEQLRQLAKAETLARSGDPHSLIITMLSVISLIVLVLKLTDILGKRPAATDSQRSSANGDPVTSVKRRTDAVSTETGPKRTPPRRTHYKTRPIPSGEAGDPAAGLKRPPTRGR